MGCQTEPAEMQADKITVVDRFPAVIQIQGPRAATLSMFVFGGQTLLHMRKTKEATDFLCE
jgi:hypothetical protein